MTIEEIDAQKESLTIEQLEAEVLARDGIVAHQRAEMYLIQRILEPKRLALAVPGPAHLGQLLKLGEK